MNLERKTIGSDLVLALILASLVCPSFAASQQASPAQHEISGDELPKYYVVREFLRNGYSKVERSIGRENAGSRSRFNQFLSELGLHEDKATVAFQSAAIELQERTFDFSLLDQPAEFRSDQEARLRAQARRIGEIYGELLALCLKSGMSPGEVAAVDESIDAKYRPNISLFWRGEPNLVYLAEEQEFETGVNRYYNTQDLTGWVF